MPAPTAGAPLSWSLVVPVKVLARAKTRLAALAGPDRPALALAMAADTVAAALGCPEVGRVVVVTGDPQAAESQRYQGEFIGGIKDEVVGKKLDEISVSKVAGSSLTSGGFMKAVDTIKTEAKA